MSLSRVHHARSPYIIAAMHAARVTGRQVFRTATIAMFWTLSAIVPVESATKPYAGTRDAFDGIPSTVDSRTAGNGHFPSYLSSAQTTRPNTDFPSFDHEDVNGEMPPGLGFQFDPATYDEIKLSRDRHATQPKFVLNYEPLRPLKYNNIPSVHFKNYPPFGTPEHQDDGGGDGGDGDGGDDGDGVGGGGGGGDGGNGGGGGGGNGGGGGGGGNRKGGGNRGGGGGGNRGSGGDGNREADDDENRVGVDEDEDGGQFVQREYIEQDNDSLEPDDGWRPIHNKIHESDTSANPFGRRHSPKKFPGYGTASRIPSATFNGQKQQQRFSDDPFSSHGSAENRRPVHDYGGNAFKPKPRANSRWPSRVNGDSGGRGNRPTSVPAEDADEDDPSPLQSRRLPTKKRQVCRKISKSMTPDDIEDHDVIGRKMTCMVCKDLGSSGSYEKCSYTSEPNADDFVDEPDETAPAPKRNQFKIRVSNRFKRRIVDGPREKIPNSGEEVVNDDYGSYDDGGGGDVKGVESEEYTAATDYENDPDNSETAENESEEFSLPPFPTGSSTCRKVTRKGNVCNVCRDNLSNRQYEQCEYGDVPEREAYEYTTRDVYGGPRRKRQLDSDRTYDDYFKKLFPELGADRKGSLSTKFSSKDGDFGLLDNGQIGFKKTRASLLGDDDRLSMDFVGTADGDESPVNKMLGDFRSKDRSNCEKSLRDKMTCYKCKDGTGAVTEECIYVTDGGPTRRQQSYSERKKFDTAAAEPVKQNGTRRQQQQQQQQPSTLAHAYAPLYGFRYEPAAQHTHVRPHRNYRLHRGDGGPVSAVEEDEYSAEDDPAEAQSGETANVEYDEYADDPNSQQVSRHDMPDVDPFGPDGAYSEETVPVYDPVLRTWLPRYMVIKSSEEAAVDAELGFD